MSEKLCTLRKSEGGDSGNYTLKHYTTNIQFSDNTTYHYIAKGKFIYLDQTRGNASTAPVLQVFKKSGSSYVALSNEATTAIAGCNCTTKETNLTENEIYVKKNSGSSFTTSTLDVGYL